MARTFPAPPCPDQGEAGAWVRGCACPSPCACARVRAWAPPPRASLASLLLWVGKSIPSPCDMEEPTPTQVRRAAAPPTCLSSRSERRRKQNDRPTFLSASSYHFVLKTLLNTSAALQPAPILAKNEMHVREAQRCMYGKHSGFPLDACTGSTAMHVRQAQRFPPPSTAPRKVLK